MQRPPSHILPLIVLSQFAGTSLWFTGNAILPELKESLDLTQYAVSLVTSAVMLGFVAGTLVFAFFSLADRFSPARLFFLSAIGGAAFNVMIIWWATDAPSLYVLRFLTGFCIAGIYPVGMKIAADWYEKGLGKALGYLLGALVLGTAFPHLLKNRENPLPWRSVLWCTSLFAVAGGAIMLALIGDGPHRKKSGRFQWDAIGQIFGSKKWRQAAFAYFGHMWELYSFWGFVPLMLALYANRNDISLNVPLWSFLAIAMGTIGCIASGYWATRIGSARVGMAALLVSGMCCFLSPFAYLMPVSLFLLFILIWGLTVVPDSPQFSTLVTQFAPDHLRGTALTIYNSIGFSIATISLFVMDRLFNSTGMLAKENTFALLGMGAVLGVPAIWRVVRSSRQ